jgi:hypothetical protein
LRKPATVPAPLDHGERFVAEGVVRSESTQIVKAHSPARWPVSTQLRHVGLTFEMLVADPERGYRDGGAPSDMIPRGAAELRLKGSRPRRGCFEGLTGIAAARFALMPVGDRSRR